MGKSKNHALKLGLLVAVGLFLFSVAVYYMGSKQNLFSSSVDVRTYFQDVKGLMEGNKVQYSGITVGFVSNIQIVEDTLILVEMSVDKEVAQFIRKDSKVDIGSDGLMGSKIVSIYPGTKGAGKIAENEVLQTRESVEWQDVLKEAQIVIGQTKQITTSLTEVSEKINNGDGDIAVLLNDNTLTARFTQIENEMLQITATANEMMNSTNNIVEKVNRGEGDLGRLINDTVMTTDLHAVMTNLENVTDKADSVANELNVFTNRLNTGNGVIQRLVYDEKMADQVDSSFVNINNSIDEVAGAAKTIERSWIFNLFSGDK